MANWPTGYTGNTLIDLDRPARWTEEKPKTLHLVIKTATGKLNDIWLPYDEAMERIEYYNTFQAFKDGLIWVEVL